jgi:hypothetical protein
VCSGQFNLHVQKIKVFWCGINEQDEIHQRMAEVILNTALILLKKESNRYCTLDLNLLSGPWKLVITGKKVNTAMFKIHFMEVEDYHAVMVSKKSASKREYTLIILKTDIMGSRFGMCTCGCPKKEGIPCQHTVTISKLGRINRHSSIVIMPHWYTTEQWRNPFSEDTFIHTHKTLKSIKANLTPHDNIHYCPI